MAKKRNRVYEVELKIDTLTEGPMKMPYTQRRVILVKGRSEAKTRKYIRRIFRQNGIQDGALAIGAMTQVIR